MSAEHLVNDLTRSAGRLGFERAIDSAHDDDFDAVDDDRNRLLARLAAYDALAAAARIEVARADRFGCRELRAALALIDGESE